MGSCCSRRGEGRRGGGVALEEEKDVGEVLLRKQEMAADPELASHHQGIVTRVP